MALGVTDSETWEQATVQIDRGDTLVLYSDGVTDAENVEGTSFGHGRLKARAGAYPGSSAGGVLDALLTAIQDFAGEAVQPDDVTLMVLTRER